jgi:hypothetical protein
VWLILTAGPGMELSGFPKSFAAAREFLLVLVREV